jgi:hypothetical protein
VRERERERERAPKTVLTVIFYWMAVIGITTLVLLHPSHQPFQDYSRVTFQNAGKSVNTDTADSEH